MQQYHSGFYKLGLCSLLLLSSLYSLQDLNAMPEVGVAVEKVSLHKGMNTWHALDERRLVLSQSSADSFLLTLSKRCTALPAAHRLGVSASNNTVYAGFDYITADGERCAIHTINRLSPETAHALKEASTEV